jgi:thioredoxin reductase (NADPH)
MTEQIYDLIIVGSGPAGCTAAIYASRYHLNNLVLGKTKGGTISYAHLVDNYPGLNGLSGLDIMEKFEEHVKLLGSQIIYDPVDNIEKENNLFIITTDSEKKYQARAVILATGTERKKLGIPGEKELIGKGVSYCVTCDAPFYRGKTVALVGGSDAACSGAVHLAEYTKKIYLIYRKEALRAEPFWIKQWEELVKQGKAEPVFNTNITEIITKSQISNVKAELVGGVKLDNPYKGSNILEVDGVFIEIGGAPGTKLAKILKAAVDEQGYVKVNEKMETDVPGLFAAGDIVDKAKVMSQMITACAWGAIAASSVYNYLKSQSAPPQRSN